MKTRGWFTLKTKKGCLRTMALCLAVILLCGFFAHLIATDGGQVKITRLTLDVRGAAVDADLYYPVGTDSTDKLPALVVAHGGGVSKGVTEGLAEEFARRGYVVLNPSAFGAGISEQPVVDDYDLGPDEFSVVSTTGVMDAVEYLRSLEFVDQTRIGVVGHSLGALRAMLAAIKDCGYLTLNDRLLNLLHDTFGQTFTEKEIRQNADQLAAQRLNSDQLAYYTILRDGIQAEYDTRIKSICLLGTDGTAVLSLAPVEVAGHTVERNVQTNFGIILGTWDHNLPTYENRDRSGEYWHDTEEIETEQWYLLNTTDRTASMPGALFDISVADNADLQAGIAARSARVLSFIQETHSKNFYSAQAATYSVKYIEQTLGYNRGELGAVGTQALAAEDIVYLWRELFNLAAMLGMISLAVATVGLLVQTGLCRTCVPERNAVAAPMNKKRYWLFSGVTVLVTFFAMYQTNNLSPPDLPSFRALPLFASWWLTVLFLVILAVFSLVLLFVYAWSDKKTRGQTNLSQLHFRLHPKQILRILLGSALVLAVAYGSLSLLQYLFHEDYRWWMASFAEMRTEYWRWVWRYALLMLPSFLIIGASTNYLVRTDIPQWRDTAITVVVNSLGVWLLCLVNYLSLRASGVMVSSFISSYGFLVIVPITVYITRKLYLLTNSIWFGAMVNSFLLSWSLVSSCGLHCNFYYGQNWITNFFGM